MQMKTPAAAKTVCPDCEGSHVRRDPLPDVSGQWVERVCALCRGRGWLDLRQAADLREQGILRGSRRRTGPSD